MTLIELRYLVTLARTLHFGRAAEAFNVSQPTLSMAVRKLEQDLGVQVFVRLGPKVVITKAGSELLNEGRHLLKAAEDLEHRVRRVALHAGSRARRDS